MTSITEIRLTQDLETFPNDGSLVAANKLAEWDEDDYIYCADCAGAVLVTVGLHGYFLLLQLITFYLKTCETLLLRPGQNKVIQPLQGDWIFGNFHRKWFFIFSLQPTLLCKREPSFPSSHWSGSEERNKYLFPMNDNWQDEEKWAARFSVLVLSDVDTLHWGRRRFIYKEPLKRSKNVVIVNNGTYYGPDHNSHSMIYGNLPTGSFDLLHLASVFGRYFDRFEIVNSVVSNDND